MAVSSIGQVLADGQSSQAASIGQEDFLKILTTQLNYQDPLKPMDNQEFLAQMAQFASLEQSRQIGESVQNLLSVQAATQSVGLIGRTVDVNTANGSQIGTVTSLSFSNGVPAMSIRTTAGAFLTGISVSQISVVR